MEEKFKVIISVHPSNIEKALCLLKNISKDKIFFYTPNSSINKIIMKKNYNYSIFINIFNCDAFITDDCNNVYLKKLRERKCKIRILKL